MLIPCLFLSNKNQFLICCGLKQVCSSNPSFSPVRRNGFESEMHSSNHLFSISIDCNSLGFTSALGRSISPHLARSPLNHTRISPSLRPVAATSSSFFPCTDMDYVHYTTALIFLLIIPRFLCSHLNQLLILRSLYHFFVISTADEERLLPL